MALLLQVKQRHVRSVQFSNYKTAFNSISLQPRTSPSLLILNDVQIFELSDTFELRLFILFLILLKRLLLAAFMTISYLVHLFINMPQARPVNVAFIGDKKIVIDMI